MPPKTVTIHITDTAGGGVTVLTTAGSSIPGERLSPAQALATDLLSQCTRRASDVRFWHGEDKALHLVRDLTDPEGFGHAVTHEVRTAAHRVLGSSMQPATEDA